MISTDPQDRPELETVCEVARRMRERFKGAKPQNIKREVPPPGAAAAAAAAAAKKGPEKEVGGEAKKGSEEEEEEAGAGGGGGGRDYEEAKEDAGDGDSTPRQGARKELTPAPVKAPRSAIGSGEGKGPLSTSGLM